ncbi:hypothetical protein Val02_88470 [Virgisporangium aliadipatigenens]|uniref:Copper transport outer membrane protein MctB n=1 Tax=Virgisporangium aliadipatigenens TaxID=741659 RepID=A0A8J3YUV2_9ACTN|nr:copper transporter [Virgisporangium aliadipatigenens]GIJ51961.1 hypothetical protein Val02_88470 [Virgisporangium aliadipatigenens]
MINFRYHVVSLTAVFLAVALGLVVGTAAFNGPAAEELSDQVSSMRKQNDAYRTQLDDLKEAAEQEEQWATDAMPYMVADKLVNRRVLLVTTSEVDKAYVDGITTALTTNGAKITGRLTLQKKFVEPGSNQALLELGDLVQPTSVTGLPSNSNGVETSAALLGAVLLDRPAAIPADDRRKVLSGYTNGAFVTPAPEPTAPAEVTLVLTGNPYADKEGAKLNAALKTFVEQFDKAGPIVVAGSGTGGDGNLLAAIRDDATLVKQVSTVDYVASPKGRVATLLALKEQLDGQAGHYGLGGGATSLLPRLAGARNGS